MTCSHDAGGPEFGLWHRASLLTERTTPPATDGVNGPPPSDFHARALDLRKRAAQAGPLVLRRIDDLLQATGRVAAEASRNSPPRWHSEFLSALTGFRSASPEAKERLQELVDDLPFSGAWCPFLHKLASDWKNSSCRDLSPTLQHDALRGLSRELTSIGGLTLYCVMKDECTSPSLGSYREWCRNIAEARWPALVNTYPLLGRFIAQKCLQFASALFELIARLEDDRIRLHRENLLDDPHSPLVHVEFGLSDSHNSGRRVCRLEFADGRRLIYKPKPLANEAWFNAVLRTFGRCSPFARLAVIDRNQYGWCEDATARLSEGSKPAGSPEEDQARAASIAYLLNATDLHPENLIRWEGSLYLVDLETLMNGAVYEADGTAWRRLSVLATDIFKSDFSAFPRDYPKHSPIDDHLELTHPFYFFTPCEREGVRIVIVGKKNSLNKPTARAAPPFEMDVEALLRAFRRSCEHYRGLLRNMEIWKEVPENLVCRFVPRPTAFYARLLQRLYHPNFLRDGAIFSLELAELYLTLDESAEKRIALVDEEIRQLEALDVPYFWYRPHEKDIYSPAGLVQPGFLSINSVDLLKSKIWNLTESDVDEQVLLLEASFALRNQGRARLPAGRKVARKPSSTPTGEAGSALEFCRRWAQNVIEAAVFLPGEPARWIGYQGDVAAQLIRPTPADDSYYSGYWGNLVFLEAVDRVVPAATASDRISRFLDEQAHHWRAEARRDWPIDLDGLGLGGIGGKARAWRILRTVNGSR